ncbi:hypothetical protein IK146_01105 [Candidatus Saccharibacteria bacterium]|nr:hypothetical protein [Candidatus Saccharibacteria bacterium]
MREKLNPEKSENLRPLRIILAILVVILAILILDRLPTSVKNRSINKDSDGQSTMSGDPAPEGSTYFYFYGVLDELEAQTETKLKKLGVPEEEFENVAEYLSQDELVVLSAKANLVANLEKSYILSDEGDIETLMEILEYDNRKSFDKFERPYATPTEYKKLSELLSTYYHSISVIEDYDAPAE